MPWRKTCSNSGKMEKKQKIVPYGLCVEVYFICIRFDGYEKQ